LNAALGAASKFMGIFSARLVQIGGRSLSKVQKKNPCNRLIGRVFLNLNSSSQRSYLESVQDGAKGVC
jgi:hypothetical protein